MFFVGGEGRATAAALSTAAAAAADAGGWDGGFQLAEEFFELGVVGVGVSGGVDGATGLLDYLVALRLSKWGPTGQE